MVFLRVSSHEKYILSIRDQTICRQRFRGIPGGNERTGNLMLAFRERKNKGGICFWDHPGETKPARSDMTRWLVRAYPENKIWLAGWWLPNEESNSSPSVLAQELVSSKFMPEPVSNCNISAPRAYLENPPEDIVSNNRRAKWSLLLTNTPRREEREEYEKGLKIMKKYFFSK